MNDIRKMIGDSIKNQDEKRAKEKQKKIEDAYARAEQRKEEERELRAYEKIKHLDYNWVRQHYILSGLNLWQKPLIPPFTTTRLVMWMYGNLNVMNARDLYFGYGTSDVPAFIYFGFKGSLTNGASKELNDNKIEDLRTMVFANTTFFERISDVANKSGDSDLFFVPAKSNGVELCVPVSIVWAVMFGQLKHFVTSKTGEK